MAAALQQLLPPPARSAGMPAMWYAAVLLVVWCFIVGCASQAMYPVQMVDTCSTSFPGTVMHRLVQRAKVTSACRAAGTWSNVVTSFAPESIVIPGSSRSAWHLPWLQTAHWDYSSYLLHTCQEDDMKAGTQRGLECTLLFQLVLVFKALVTFAGFGDLGRVKTDYRYRFVEEFTNETSLNTGKSSELIFHFASLLAGKVDNEMTLSLFGVLQWLSAVLTFQRRSERREFLKKPPFEGLPIISP